MRKTTAIALMLAFLLAPPAAVAAGGGMTVVRDEEIERTLRAFARPVFEQAGVSPAAVRFVLVQDPSLNAFVAGGQNIFMHTGLLLRTENAQEVAGVIAHETGHIALGHLFRMHEAVNDMAMQTILANVVGLAVGIGAGSSGAGQAVAQAGTHAALRNTLTHSRTQESSADEAGIRYLRESRLPVSGLLSFMDKLADQELLPAARQDAYVRTHPLTQDRVDVLRRAAERQGAAAAVPPQWAVFHARMKAKLLGFIHPDRALADKGEGIEARYARAIAEYRKGRTDHALALIRTLLRDEPQNPWFHELKGQVLFEAGRVAESLPPYAQAVSLVPDSGLIRAAYGHALLETGSAENRQLAIAEFQKSLALEPRIASTHRFLAIAYGREGKEGLSRLHLGEQYMLEGKYDLARREARLALRALGDDQPARLRAQDLTDALDRVEKSK